MHRFGVQTRHMPARPRRHAAFVLFCSTLGLLVACGPGSSASPGATEGDDTGGTSTGGSTLPPPPGPGDATSSTTAPSPEPGSSGGATEGSGSEGDSGGFIPRPDAGGPNDPLPLGENCEADDECDSMHCFMIGDFGFGVCSECAHDSDCMAGGGPGTCSLSAGWAACTDGGAGAMCESSEGCATDLVCAPTFEFSPFSFCSQCATESECAEGEGCAPTSDVGNVCVTPGSLELDELCPAEGGIYCGSGHCTEALYMGDAIGIWLCGGCSTDDDCRPGQTCTPAFLTDTDFGGSVCA